MTLWQCFATPSWHTMFIQLLILKLGVTTHGELTTMKEAFMDDVTQMRKLLTQSGHSWINLFGDSNGSNGGTESTTSNQEHNHKKADDDFSLIQNSASPDTGTQQSMQSVSEWVKHKHHWR